MAAKILIAVISLIGTAAFAKNVTLGDPSKGRLVYEQTFEMEPSPNNTATGIKNISVPDETIKAIEIEDLQGDGRVSILEGGIGKSNVKIALYGDRDKGFRFRVKIYIEPKPEKSTETPEETTKSTQETDGTTKTEETTESEETEGTEKPEETTPMNSRTRTRKPGKNKKQKPQHRKKPHSNTLKPEQRNQKTPDDEPNDNDYYNRPCDCACVSWYPCWSYNNCC